MDIKSECLNSLSVNLPGMKKQPSSGRSTPTSAANSDRGGKSRASSEKPSKSDDKNTKNRRSAETATKSSSSGGKRSLDAREASKAPASKSRRSAEPQEKSRPSRQSVETGTTQRGVKRKREEEETAGRFHTKVTFTCQDIAVCYRRYIGHCFISENMSIGGENQVPTE